MAKSSTTRRKPSTRKMKTEAIVPVAEVEERPKRVRRPLLDELDRMHPEEAARMAAEAKAREGRR